MFYYNKKQKKLSGFLTNIVIHHTNNSNSIADVEQKQVSKGYAALGYHFFISKKGEIYEGRPLEIMGSNTGAGKLPGAYFDPDFGAVGITMQGDYHHSDDWLSSDKAPKAQLASLEKLVVAVKNKFIINQLLMHREIIRSGKPTVCPGDHMVGHVVSLRKKLGMRGVDK